MRYILAAPYTTATGMIVQIFLGSGSIFVSILISCRLLLSSAPMACKSNNFFRSLIHRYIHLQRPSRDHDAIDSKIHKMAVTATRASLLSYRIVSMEVGGGGERAGAGHMNPGE